ncbi:MAG TPA: lysophospholipid acyltransferase family protein [Longimicrobiaceae bacterium]|nr:lysophospholipid acyltransferase family protein [Longimicrobiaceae bacterium]
MRRAPDWKDRAEYALARGAELGIGRLPERGAERLGQALGNLVRSPLGIRREVVRENLRRAFPTAAAEWIEETTRAAFAHLGRETVAMLRLAELSPAEILRRVEIDGEEELREASREGRGMILVTGHLGNWEVAAATAASLGFPIDAVMKRMRNPLLDARLDETRRRLGIGTIDMKDAPREVPGVLASGKALGLVADQDAGRRGLWVPFFGQLASTHRGPALFALRYGAPLLFARAARVPGAGYSIRVERLTPPGSGDLAADVLALTTAWTQRLEAAVRAAPEQYFWFHKRWKTRPAEEPQGAQSGITRADGLPGAPTESFDEARGSL